MLAIPVYQSRVAPVLNWCTSVLIMPKDSSECSEKEELPAGGMNCFDLLKTLRDRGVTTIICGALTADLLSYGQHLGIEIIYGVSGPIDQVLKAYHSRQLDEPSLRLPGYGRSVVCRQLREQGWSCRFKKASEILSSKKENTMSNYQNKGGKNQGQLCRGGRGRGGGTKQGRGKGLGQAVEEVCLCPGCGKKFPHSRGIPCSREICPDCGLPMVRKGY